MQLEEMPHLEEDEITDKDQLIHDFHGWMRQETTLKSGTIIEYRKKVFQLLEEGPKLVVDREELSTRENTAVNKFEEYLEADKPVSCDSQGDTE